MGTYSDDYDEDSFASRVDSPNIDPIDFNNMDTNMASSDTKTGDRYPKAEIRDQKSIASLVESYVTLSFIVYLL